MSEQRAKKYLEGELKYVEGKTTIKDFLHTLSTRIVSQQWIPLERNLVDPSWTFNLRREIWLNSSYDPQNVRVYLAEMDEDGNFQKGELIDSENYHVINNIIRGVGEGEGVQIGDRVLIDVNYEPEFFQQVTFLENELPSGDIENLAKMKSRPQGKIKIYEEVLQDIENEELYQVGGDEVYRFGKYPVSNAEGEKEVVIYRDGDVIPKEEYTIDYFNGVVLFHVQQDHNTLITADYKFRTGVKGSEIPESNYEWYNDTLIDRTETGELKNTETIVEVDYYWMLHYPSLVEDVRDSDRVVFKTDVDVSSSRNFSRTKTYYWELKYYNDSSEKDSYLTGIQSRFGATLDDEDDTTLDEELSSEWAKWSWYKEEGFDDGLIFRDWLPIRYWINFTKEYANFVLQGDPSPDVHPYNNYVISYGYLGMVKPYENAVVEDYENNFAMTIGSDQHPEAESEYPTTWGLRTGTGVSDIVMEKTDSNIPYQAHLPSFHTSPEFMDKHFIHASEFTGSHSFSEVTVTHAYERERGKLQGMLIGDRSSIFHLDELISNKDHFDTRGALIGGDKELTNKCGFPFESKEKRWVMFNINAPYWFANNSPNVHYGIAIRKS